MNLYVLYPQPTNVEKFKADYKEHVTLLHQKMEIPLDVKPYQVTRFLEGPAGKPPYFLMFSMPFKSAEEIQEVMSTSAMQEVAADANRISSGGAPTIMIGE